MARFSRDCDASEFGWMLELPVASLALEPPEDIADFHCASIIAVDSDAGPQGLRRPSRIIPPPLFAKLGTQDDHFE